MDKSFAGTDATRVDRFKYGKYLQNIEGLADYHFDTTPVVGDPWKNFRS